MLDKEYKVTFGSVTITFYPLSVKDIRSMPDEMQALARSGENPFAPERFRKLLALWTASAKRGDPNITEEMVEQVVDFRNLVKVNRAILGQDWEKEPEVVKAATNGSGAVGVEEVPPTSPLIGGASTQG